MLRRFKILALTVLLLMMVIQVYRPEQTNPIVDSKQGIHAILTADPQVVSVMSRSCNDCHSNQTTWPWYSRVAPASWLVVSDVNRGRTAVNFSEWGKYKADQQSELLKDVCEEISAGEMPAFQYSLMHRTARLTAAEQAAVCRWTKENAVSRERVAAE